MTETTTAPASPPAALPTTDVCVMCGEEQAERRGLCPLCRAEVELIYAPTLRARIVALWRHPEVRSALVAWAVAGAAGIAAALLLLATAPVPPGVVLAVAVAAVAVTLLVDR